MHKAVVLQTPNKDLIDRYEQKTLAKKLKLLIVMTGALPKMFDFLASQQEQKKSHLVNATVVGKARASTSRSNSCTPSAIPKAKAPMQPFSDDLDAEPFDGFQRLPG